LAKACLADGKCYDTFGRTSAACMVKVGHFVDAGSLVWTETPVEPVIQADDD